MGYIAKSELDKIMKENEQKEGAIPLEDIDNGTDCDTTQLSFENSGAFNLRSSPAKVEVSDEAAPVRRFSGEDDSGP